MRAAYILSFVGLCQALAVPDLNSRETDTEVPIGFDPDAIAATKDVPLPQDIDVKEVGAKTAPGFASLFSLKAATNGSDDDDDDDLAPFMGEPETNSTLEDRAIFGPDDRKVYTGSAYPYRAMGRIARSDGGVCSGALVGKRHVLSAKHCLKKGVSYTFQPLFDKKAKYPTSVVTHSYSLNTNIETSCGRRDDWVVFILKDPLGTKAGFLGVDPNPEKQFGKKNQHNFGYPGDRDNTQRPYIQSGFEIKSMTGCSNGGALISTADTAGGQSGGPVWYGKGGDLKNPFISGVHVASSSQRAVHAHTASLIATVKKAKKDHP